MDSAHSEIIDICPESARYAEKSLFTLYAIHAPGAGTKCCWVPEVSYLGSV